MCRWICVIIAVALLLNGIALAQTVELDRSNLLGLWKLSDEAKKHYHIVGSATTQVPSYEFDENGKLTMYMMGIPMPVEYEITGNIIEVKLSNKNSRLLKWKNYALYDLEFLFETDDSKPMYLSMDEASRQQAIRSSYIESIEQAFTTDSTVFNPYLEVQSIVLAKGAYTDFGEKGADTVSAAECLTMLGFDSDSIRGYNYDIEQKYEDHKVAFVFGTKRSPAEADSQSGHVVVAIAIRGTRPLPEWISDFTTGTDTEHVGFNTAMKEVYDCFLDYCSQQNIDLQKDNVKIWLTGHSRGAGVANLLGAKLLTTGRVKNEEDLYAYTYACPLVTLMPRVTSNAIRNFNIPGDIAPHVPLADWGYRANGSTTLLYGGALGASEEQGRMTAKIAKAMYDIFETNDEYWEKFVIVLGALLEQEAEEQVASGAGGMSMESLLEASVVRKLLVKAFLILLEKDPLRMTTKAIKEYAKTLNSLTTMITVIKLAANGQKIMTFIDIFLEYMMPRDFISHDSGNYLQAMHYRHPNVIVCE